MSQSPLARNTRRSLPAFSHTPSRLSHSTSRSDLASLREDTPTNAGSSSSASSSKAQTPSRSTSTPQNTAKNDSLRYRSTGTGTATATPPHTPKIVYSPYALSTPPSALSKSTSIPFDMAANAKAGLKANESGSRRQSMATDADSTPMEGKGKKRFVRKKPFWQKIISMPEDIYEQIVLHYPLSFEELQLPVATANPLSLALHAVHWILLAPLFNVREEAESVLRSSPPRKGVGGRWDRYEEAPSVLKRGLGGGWTTLIITVILILLASANSVYLFTKYRTYSMQTRSAQEPVRSPHASPISAPRRQGSEDVFGAMPTQSTEEGSRNKKVLRLTGRASWFFVKWSFWTLFSIFGLKSSPVSYSDNDDKIQSLRVWDAPDWCLAFFCAYPPSAPLLSYLLTPLHPFITPVLHLITSFLLSHLAATYNQLVKDRMLLSAEVMREYDRRFVYKRVFGARVDRSTQTEEAEMLW